jgi:hypothetical protein
VQYNCNMKKILTFCSSLFILFGIVPSVFAADTGIAQLAGCSGVDCSACNVVYLANGGIKWLIGILFVIFGLLMAIAGVKLVTSGGNHHALDEAKSSFTNAIIGFIIILSAWLIVDTIMRGLVGGPGREGMIGGEASGWLFWSEVECQDQTNPDWNDVTQEEVAFLDLPASGLSSSPGWTFVPVSGGGGQAGSGDSTFTASCTRLPGPASEIGQFNCSTQQAKCTAEGGRSTITDSGRVLSCVVPPSGGSGGSGSNCGVNESTLVSIPGQGSQRATAATVSRFVNMKSQLAASGINLSVTSSYRSDARQTELWDECPRCQSEGTVAKPCSRGGNGSAHSSGVAIDLNSNGNRCDIIRACRSAGASFIMTYSRSGHVHCDWRGSGRREKLTISC